MKPLEDIYKRTFFGKRYRLDWRAKPVVNAVRVAFNMLPGQTVVDVGCAIGEYVREFQRQGFPAEGIEGSMRAEEFFVAEPIMIHDLRKPLVNGKRFDVVMSLEVAEHIEPEHAEQYVLNLMKLAKRSILITAAPPGQGGHYHVNCQPQGYWAEKFFRRAWHRSFLREEMFKDSFEARFRHRKELRAYIQNVMIFRK
jgi:cyclopropane fatty-acyl-phospholipid synthase-like methyltransferase